MENSSIYFSMVPVIYPYADSIQIEDIEIPTDLKDYIDKSEFVVRFADEDYQLKGMIIDNTKVHTIRCVFLAKSLFPRYESVERILWLHDIPEIVSDKDTNALARFNNKDLADTSNDIEYKFAESVFDKQDLSYYTQFVLAEKLLTGRSDEYPEMEEAILSKIIDVVDGNLIFTYFFITWLHENDYDGRVPTESSFTYPINFYNQVDRVIKKSSYSDWLKESVELLKRHHLTTRLSLWETIPLNKIPEKMKEQLELTKAVVS